MQHCTRNFVSEKTLWLPVLFFFFFDATEDVSSRRLGCSRYGRHREQKRHTPEQKSQAPLRATKHLETSRSVYIPSRAALTSSTPSLPVREEIVSCWRSVDEGASRVPSGLSFPCVVIACLLACLLLAACAALCSHDRLAALPCLLSSLSHCEESKDFPV